MKISEAVKWSGKSRATIMRAIKDHKIVAKKGDGGVWDIDASSLASVYQLKRPDEVEGDQAGHDHDHQNDLSMSSSRTGQMDRVNTPQINALQDQLEAERRLSEERGKTIDDLRQRLDHEQRRRDEIQVQFTALLTDQREKAPQSAVEGRRVHPGYWAALAVVLAIVGASLAALYMPELLTSVGSG